MNNATLYAGYLRLNELLVKSIDLARHGAKKEAHTLMKTLISDFDDYIEVLAKTAGITDDDLQKFAEEDVSDDILVKMASHQSAAMERQAAPSDTKPESSQ